MFEKLNRKTLALPFVLLATSVGIGGTALAQANASSPTQPAAATSTKADVPTAGDKPDTTDVATPGDKADTPDKAEAGDKADTPDKAEAGDKADTDNVQSGDQSGVDVATPGDQPDSTQK